MSEAPSYDSLKEAIWAAFHQASLSDPTTDLVEIELRPAQNGSGDWFALFEDYYSRNATPAQALLGCLLLLIRDHYGIYILLNETQRAKLGMNLVNY
ncbi:MAG: hypothetical protein ACKO7W_08975 [Elainella sp.]